MTNRDNQRTTGLTIAENIHGFAGPMFISDLLRFAIVIITAKDTEYMIIEITIPITNAINHSIIENSYLRISSRSRAAENSSTRSLTSSRAA